MTREDVLKLFPEATDEQITNLLNRTNSELAKERTIASQYKDKSAQAEELQAKLKELENGKLTELEKATKELDEAKTKIAEMQKTNAIRDLREKAMSDFKITADQVKSVILDDGSWDTTALGKIISEKELTSATAKEQEIARNAGNPNGNGVHTDSSTDTTSQMAKTLASSMISTSKESEAIVESYM